MRALVQSLSPCCAKRKTKREGERGKGLETPLYGVIIHLDYFWREYYAAPLSAGGYPKSPQDACSFARSHVIDAGPLSLFSSRVRFRIEFRVISLIVFTFSLSLSLLASHTLNRRFNRFFLSVESTIFSFPFFRNRGRRVE